MEEEHSMEEKQSMEERRKITFLLRVLHNQIKLAIHKSLPDCKVGPKSQLQGGILGYLYHHQEVSVYQRDLEKEFRISRATATNTLQVMEREGLIIRKAQDRDGRLKRIQMTETAYQGHMQMEAHMEMMDSRLLEGMDDAEVSKLYHLLGIMLKNLEGMVEEFSGPPEEVEPECRSLKEG